MKGAWWRSEEVKEKAEIKQEKHKALVSSKTDEEKEVNKVQYQIAKREAKKAMEVAKNNAYKRLYQRLDSKQGQKRVLQASKGQEKTNKRSKQCKVY